MNSKIIRCLILMTCLGCGSRSEVPPTVEMLNSDAEKASVNSDEQAQVPDDPFFRDYVYPGTTALDALTMRGATSVWYQTDDSMAQVQEFYNQKFEGAIISSRPSGLITPELVRTMSATDQPSRSSMPIRSKLS